MLFVLTVWLQAGETVSLGLMERDLTGDGRAEILRLTGVGPATDALDVEFTIESDGTTVYRFKLHPVPRLRLNEFAPWFFAREKFQRPAEFVAWLRASAPDLHLLAGRRRDRGDRVERCRAPFLPTPGVLLGKLRATCGRSGRGGGILAARDQP